MTNNLEKILEECGKSVSSLLDGELDNFFFQTAQDSIIKTIKKETVKNLPCNSNLVKEVAIWDKDHEIRREAILRISDQKWLTEKVISDANIYCKLAAISKLNSEENLKDLLMYEDMPKIAIRNIVKKINAQSLLEDLLLSKKVCYNAKLYIIDKLENKEFLEDITKDERINEDIKLLVLNRLEEL